MIIRKYSFKKLIAKSLLCACVLGSYACGSRYNTIEQEDPNAGSERVYGNIGGPPKQANNTYEADPNANARAAAIREKMFGNKGNTGNLGQSEQGR